MRAVVRSSRADEDLIAIWVDIAVHDPAAADRTLDAIANGWSRLTRFPLSGRSLDDLSPGLRQNISGKYLTFYCVSDTAIEIVRVLHGRRRIDVDAF